jgi:hypothetical protein
VLFDSRKAADIDHGMIEFARRDSVLQGVGCCRWCSNNHQVIDLTADGNAIADQREFGPDAPVRSRRVKAAPAA